eukprot:1381064-Pyramimonas_sp.AAC.1
MAPCPLRFSCPTTIITLTCTVHPRHGVQYHYYSEADAPANEGRDDVEWLAIKAMVSAGLVSFGEPCIVGFLHASDAFNSKRKCPLVLKCVRPFILDMTMLILEAICFGMFTGMSRRVPHVGVMVRELPERARSERGE